MRIDRRARESSSPRIFGLLRLLTLFAIQFFDPFPAAAAQNIKLVVVLYPDNNDGSPGNSLVDQSIRATFAAGSSDRIEIHNEYLDVSPVRNDDFKQLQTEFLRQKYVGRKVDLVIAGLSSGLDFVLARRERIFPGVPIVFCAVDEREVRARKLPPDVIGVPIKMDLLATLDLALQLHPNTERVFVIAGMAKFDADWEAEARQAFRAYEDKLEFVYLTKLRLEDLLEEVSHLPDRSIIYYLHVVQDGTGKILVPAEVLALLAAKANAPVYGHIDSYVGRGIVGGRVFSWETEGTNAAKLGLRILAGEKPEAIGVQKTGANTYMFDWRQLQRWDIREESLPPGSVVRHREPSLWDLYRWHISGVISLCVIQALLIVVLCVQRANRRRAEEQFLRAVEAAPNGMLLVGPEGHIVLANAHMERLFGYRKEELLGQPVEMLVPERFRKYHPAHRDRFFASPGIRPMGAGRDVFGCRKDGSEFPVEIGLSPIQTDAGLFVMASVVDLTERKRAEKALQASEKRYRTLFEKANDAIFLETEDDVILAVNQRACELLGYSREELLAMKVPDLQAPEVRGGLGTVIKGELAKHQDNPFEGLDFHRDGRRIPVEVTDAIIDENGKRLVLSIVRDITERKQAEEDLRESERELRLLTGRLFRAQETERCRIARELHDDLSQSLALLSVELDHLGQKTPESAPELKGWIHALSTQVKQLSSSVHDLSHELHPSILEQLGLVAAIRALCKGLTQAHGLSIEFTHHETPAAIPEDVALCLYRIVQEALGNVLKHSGARHADVELIGSANEIDLRIVDDGSGFDPGLANVQEGLGLVSMRERLRLVAGEIAIDSRPSEGTRIDVRIPLTATGSLQAEPARIG